MKYGYSNCQIVRSVFVIMLVMMLTPGFALADGHKDRPNTETKKHNDIYDINLDLEAANQGDAIAQNRVGLMYYQGIRITRDYAEALKWFGKSANRGYAGAQYNLGKMYYFEIGMMGNHDSEAMVWFQKAAEQGNVEAQFATGMMYYDGSGVPVNYAEAMKWFKKAASLGNAQAYNQIGVLYETGQGATKNYSEAKRWYQMSATLGCWDAKNNLARLEHQTNLPVQISRIPTDKSLLEKYRDKQQEQKFSSQSDQYYKSYTYTRKDYQESCALLNMLGLALALSGRNISSSQVNGCR